MNSNTVEVRIAKETDILLLVNFCRDTFYNMWKDYNTDEDLATYMDEYFTPPVIAKELADSNITYLIASDQNKTVGYCKLKRNYREGDLNFLRVVEMQRMYTTKQTLRKGIGTQLMKRAIEMLRAENFEVMWLGVYEKNFNAIAFYSHFGFKPYGSHDFVLGNDVTTDILMMLPLNK